MSMKYHSSNLYRTDWELNRNGNNCLFKLKLESVLGEGEAKEKERGVFVWALNLNYLLLLIWNYGIKNWMLNMFIHAFCFFQLSHISLHPHNPSTYLFLFIPKNNKKEEKNKQVIYHLRLISLIIGEYGLCLSTSPYSLSLTFYLPWKLTFYGWVE